MPVSLAQSRKAYDGIDIKKSSSCFVCNSSLDTQETTETTEETIVVKVASIAENQSESSI